MANTAQGAYEFLVLQYDGSGNFRVVSATPATAQAIGMIGSAGISHWSYPAVSAYAAGVADNGNVVSSNNSPASYMAVTLPSTTAIPMGWTIGLASDGNKTMSAQVNSVSGGHILYPGSGSTATSVALASGNYEFVALRFDGSNFRITEATPQTATAIGVSGSAPGINRWSFPAVSTYTAGQRDSGNALSSYNTPGASLTVTLPPPAAIGAGWIMGLATDNGKAMTVQVDGGSGARILYPAGATGTAATSISLAAINYEFAALQFDGSNFRIVSITPRSASALGMLGHQIYTGATPTLGSGSSDCGTSPAIGGNDSAGRVTVGSSANGGKCTINFAVAWPNPPICSVSNETSANLVRPTAASTTSVALAGTLTAGDSLVLPLRRISIIVICCGRDNSGDAPGSQFADGNWFGRQDHEKLVRSLVRRLVAQRAAGARVRAGHRTHSLNRGRSEPPDQGLVRQPLFALRDGRSDAGLLDDLQRQVGSSGRPGDPGRMRRRSGQQHRIGQL